MASEHSQSATSYERYKKQIHELEQMKIDLGKLKNELTTAQTTYYQHLCDYETKIEQLNILSDKIRLEQDEKQMNLLNATKECLDINEKLKSSVMLPNQKVKLNVGGEYFETTIETLTKPNEEKTSYFQVLFSRQWEIEKDPKDESIFIDRDGVLFNYILQYLRTGQLNIDPNDLLLRQDLIKEAEFYTIAGLVRRLKMNDRIPQQPKLEKIKLYSDTKILTPKYQEQLNKLFGSDHQQWQLIYRASRDGFTAKLFHQFCDGCSPTMSVVQSKNGYIFGAYTTVAWTSSNEDKADASAFLFTLTNPHGIKPTKYPVSDRSIRFAVSHRPTNGPTFGSTNNGGSDIYLQNPFTAVGSRFFFPRTYEDTTGRGWATFI
jgi:hypothetical protein